MRKEEKKWNRSGPNQIWVTKIKWEMLQNERKKDEYANRTRVLLNEGDWDVSVGEWEKMSEVIVKAAKEVCGLREKGCLTHW